MLLPMVLFGGFLVKVNRMPKYLHPFSWASFLRFGFEGMMITMYGRGRCEHESQLYLNTHPSINITTVKPPKWATYLPAFLESIEKSSKDSTNHPVEEKEYEYDYEEEVDQVAQSRKTYEQLMAMFGGNFLKEKGKMNFDKSAMLEYFELNDAKLYRAFVVILFFILFFRIISFLVLRWKLRSSN